MVQVLSTAVSKGFPFKTSNELVHEFASRYLTEFVNEMNSRKKTSLCFQRFMSVEGFYLTTSLFHVQRNSILSKICRAALKYASK